ncbi:MAG TPA: ABC transporter permease [Limnochordia bacterium]|jgi:ABC-2 type transport system permease protein|nr:ABC transporter permease [Limnochordia bacterium]
MIHFVVFFKKETKESIRTYALLIMAVVFAVLGIMNPLVAKLTPELIPKLMPEGINITMPEPSSLDSWSQFFKNIQQMGLVVTMLVFSGSLPNEVAKGTLINLLTKGLSRRAVIFAKYAAMAAIWTLSMAISLVVTWTYTIYFFPDGKAQHVLLAAFWLWTFGAFLLAVMLCAATLVVSSYGSLLISGAAVVTLMILNVIPAVQKYNPLSLAGRNMDLVTGNIGPASLVPALIITLVAIPLLILLAAQKFAKKQL